MEEGTSGKWLGVISKEGFDIGHGKQQFSVGEKIEEKSHTFQ